MKDQFADYETSKMLKEIEMNEKLSFGYYQHGGELIQKQTNNGQQQATYEAYLWQQAEAWLWEKYKLYFNVELHEAVFFQCNISCSGILLFTSNIEKSKSDTNPLIAKIERIKQAVKYLHEQLKK